MVRLPVFTVLVDAPGCPVWRAWALPVRYRMDSGLTRDGSGGARDRKLRAGAGAGID